MGFDETAAAPYTFVLNERTRILAIDDDPIQREFASVYLSTPSTTVDTTDSAISGLELLAEKIYDIVLLDIDMPGMDGIAMLEAIRSTPLFANLPVVIVTGCEDVVSIDRAYAAGATSFITKPVNWRVLSYHLRFVLRAQTPTITDLARGAARPAPLKYAGLESAGLVPRLATAPRGGGVEPRSAIS